MLKNLKEKVTRGEFSKRLLVFIEVFICCTFVLVCVAVFKGLVEALTAWIAGLFSLASMAFGFYYWKAKNENIRKYGNLSSEDVNKIAKIYSAIFNGYDQEGEE